MYAVQLTADAELCPLEPRHAAEFLAHVEKARADIVQYIPWAAVVVDESSARSFLQAYADRQAADTGRIDGIWLGGELVGGVLFRTFDLRFGTCEIGVWLNADAQGKGLITRACQVLIDWAIGERGIYRLEWKCSTDNEPSKAVARRLGLTHEGVLRAAFPVGPIRQDLEVWSLLAPDWQTRPWA
ncbi:GNAT family N-acetyltransferase [Kribbella sp. NBC_01245]|uniref:GNAT family N-acetyltransferase n=1 Tax=Kribbella sp. NBC_01245 TaxID=2903578 RepID=UPI002E2DF4AA|nr:GNAT family protein [Kribbella sp. NBC_01245]